MSHPTCCCASLDRCDRCDLLVGLEGFHLMSVARTSQALVLDIESCDCLAGCPGCGLNRSRPRARGGGGDRRALGRGPGADPMAQYGARYAANTPARSRLSLSRTTRCAHLGRVWVCGRSAGRSDSCASREPPLQDWLDNWQPRGIPCGPISSRVCKPHLMTLPVLRGVRVLGVDERRVASPGPTPPGPRELTGIVDHSRGGSSHGPLERTWSQEGLATRTRTG